MKHLSYSNRLDDSRSRGSTWGCTYADIRVPSCWCRPAWIPILRCEAMKNFLLDWGKDRVMLPFNKEARHFPPEWIHSALQDAVVWFDSAELPAEH